MSQSDAVTDRTQEATANGDEGAKMGADGNSDVGLDETEARQRGAAQNSVADIETIYRWRIHQNHVSSELIFYLLPSVSSHSQFCL